MSLIRPFVIGSSYIVFAPYYYAVLHYQPKKNYSYEDYTFVAPVWFGMWNSLSAVLARKFNLTLRQRFALISILSGFSVSSIAFKTKSFKFNRDEWIKYFKYVFVKYIIVWNIIIYNLELYV